MPTFIEKQFKFILNKKKYIDSWFWDRYSINPYNGCLFGCIYCDARSNNYHMPTDFENNIIIKQNVGTMLDKRLSRARTLLSDVVGIGGVTDSYQAAETKYGNTHACLEILAKHRYPVHIATKSDLVLGDGQLLDEIGQQTWCTVSFTITTLDPDLTKFLDQRAPSPQKRLDALRELKQTYPHVQAGVLIIPLIPYLTDEPAALAALVAASKVAGADYVLFGGGMSLRDSQARYFLGHLSTHFPDIYAKYKTLYQFDNATQYDGQSAPPSAYLLPKYRLLFDLCAQYELPYRIPRFIPDDWRQTNYRIAEQLLNTAYERQMLGNYWQNHYWAGAAYSKFE